MKTTRSESIISRINTNVFFKEFTFSKNDFKTLDTNQQLEFADNVVWMDDLFFIYQIKDREGNNSGVEQWFNNKVINKGVKQIKSTLKYIDTYPEIYIENEKGHKLNIVEAKKCKKIRKIIIYTPTLDFPEEKRNKKFYESSEVGLIHLFHSEDYYWICKYLFTPTEVDEYLEFREQFFLMGKDAGNALPEQYYLAHFLETPATDHFDASYITNLQQKKISEHEFDISLLIENFAKHITLTTQETEYYHIIKEISKLNRLELTEFKKRFSLAVEKCETAEIITPYRIYIPRTDCGFVFIPLHSSKSQFWKNALQNFTFAHKYDQKAKKCIGVVVFKETNNSGFCQLFWAYVEGDWVFDETIEQSLKDNFPFRKVSSKNFGNPYK